MNNLVSKGAALLLLAAQRAVGAAQSVGAKLADTDIAQSIVNGAQIAKDKIMYIRSAQAAVAGRQIILNEAISKSLGTTNFENGALPKGRAMVVTHLRVASMTNASITGDEYSPVITDPGIANGEIFIQTQDGKELYQGPIGPMLPTSAPDKANDTWFELENPILLQPGQNIQIDMFFAVATAATTNVEVALKGVENVNR